MFASGTFDFRAVVEAATTGQLPEQPGRATRSLRRVHVRVRGQAPLWPFHRWLPDAAVGGDPATAVLMMAVVDKVGTFGMLRYRLQLFPDSAAFLPLIITLAVIGIVYGAVAAIGQRRDAADRLHLDQPLRPSSWASS